MRSLFLDLLFVPPVSRGNGETSGASATLIQHPANGLGNMADDSPSIWAHATHMGEPEIAVGS